MTKATRTVIISPYFARDVRRLEREYRHVSDDSVKLIDQLADGETPGDHMCNWRIASSC